jgi:hypothetical protein
MHRDGGCAGVTRERADLRECENHASWREVYRELDVDTSIEPREGDDGV